MKKQKFYKCGLCGNIVGIIDSKGPIPSCCGAEMAAIVSNTVEASTEKHIPVVKVDGNTISVSVGSAAHPMEEKHYIQFIYLETEKGGQRKALSAGAEPAAKFSLIDDKPVAVYAYCNLHGLWKAEAV